MRSLEPRFRLPAASRPRTIRIQRQRSGQVMRLCTPGKFLTAEQGVPTAFTCQTPRMSRVGTDALCAI